MIGTARDADAFPVRWPTPQRFGATALRWWLAMTELLDLALDRSEPTKDTLRLRTQIVGKVRMAVAPPQNHWWHVTLYVDARGFTTRRLPPTPNYFEVAFDFIDHQLVVRTTGGDVESFPLWMACRSHASTNVSSRCLRRSGSTSRSRLSPTTRQAHRRSRRHQTIVLRS